MKFNELTKVIVENITPAIANEELEGKRGRTPNPEIEKLVAQGIPYWKARALVKKGLTGSATPVVKSEPGLETEPLEGSVSASKTQAAIDDFVVANPEASVEDIVSHLKALNAGPLEVKYPYVTSPKEVAKMLAIATGGGAFEEPEFDPEAERKAKMAKLRAFLMLPKAKRDEILARKAKVAKATKSYKDEDEDEEEPMSSIDMRDEPIDPIER